uniref:Dopamine beta-hydroxylase n=1 Tax=Cynoglossus semilaevis TaxID=244447 RepID=A0A3P8WJ24_CYNSE
MRIFNQNLRLQDIVVMYFTGLALLMVIMVASYPAPKASIPLPPLPMPYQVSLDPRGELQLAWNISDANQEVYIRLTATAKLKYGVVLGMSDRGELTNADLVVLWDSGAKTYFGDAWSDANGQVSLDRQQDYELLEAKQNPDGIQLLFKRPFSTCDPRDYLIEEGTVDIIYGVLDQPLASLEQLNLFSIHTGMLSITMLQYGIPPTQMPPDTKFLDVAAPNVTIPSQETTYWCFNQQLPADMPKNHILMFESAITPGNEDIVHHIEVFECLPGIADVPQNSGACDDIMAAPKLNFCSPVLATWAKGAEPFYFPPDVGMPIGGPGSSKILRMEIHYHNPLLMSGRRDSSGIRLYYTPSLRRYDAGVMELGLVYTPLMAIPPKQHNFYLRGYCTPKCTEAALPKEGILIFASQLHAHLAGRALRTVLVRGGKEVEVVKEDKHFSTYYHLNNLSLFLPIALCPVGGNGFMDEMCVNFIYYYPRIELEVCKSNVDPESLQKYFSSMNRFQGNDQCACSNVSVKEQYSQVHWDKFSVEELNYLYKTAPIYEQCTKSNGELLPGDWEKQPIPKVTTVLPQPHYPCEGRAASNCPPTV